MKRVTALYLVILLSLQAMPQGKKALSIDDLVTWNRISERVISDDGSLIAFKTEPSQGDPVVTLYDTSGQLKATFNCATGVSISSDSRFLFFTVKTPEDTVRALKLKKTKKDDMPLDKLGIYNVATGLTDTIARLKSYKVPAKWAGWIAWQTEPLKEKNAAPKDTAGNGGEKKQETGMAAGREPGTETGKEAGKAASGQINAVSGQEVSREKGRGNGKKPKTESADNGYTMYYRNLSTGVTDSVRFVTEYLFAEEAEKLAGAVIEIVKKVK